MWPSYYLLFKQGAAHLDRIMTAIDKSTVTHVVYIEVDPKPTAKWTYTGIAIAVMLNKLHMPHSKHAIWQRQEAVKFTLREICRDNDIQFTAVNEKTLPQPNLLSWMMYYLNRLYPFVHNPTESQ
jgi:hypothetical protein